MCVCVLGIQRKERRALQVGHTSRTRSRAVYIKSPVNMCHAQSLSIAGPAFPDLQQLP